MSEPRGMPRHRSPGPRIPRGPGPTFSQEGTFHMEGTNVDGDLRSGGKGSDG